MQQKLHTLRDDTDNDETSNMPTSGDDTSKPKEDTRGGENNDINTSGEDRNDTRQSNGTLLQDPVNYNEGTIASDTAYSICMSGEDTYGSDEDTGYKSDDQGKQRLKEEVKGTHNLEAKSANKTTSRTTSPKIM